MIAEVMGFVFGKHAENWKILNDSWGIAIKRFMKANPNGRTFTTKVDIEKFLSKGELERYKKAEKEFDEYWKNERRKWWKKRGIDSDDFIKPELDGAG